MQKRDQSGFVQEAKPITNEPGHEERIEKALKKQRRESEPQPKAGY